MFLRLQRHIDVDNKSILVASILSRTKTKNFEFLAKFGILNFIRTVLTQLKSNYIWQTKTERHAIQP